jgi:hypothetical protein
MKMAVVIAGGLAAGISAFSAYLCSLAGTKKSCSCGQSCSCSNSGCSCNEVIGTAGRCDRTFYK